MVVTYCHESAEFDPSVCCMCFTLAHKTLPVSKLTCHKLILDRDTERQSVDKYRTVYVVMSTNYGQSSTKSQTKFGSSISKSSLTPGFLPSS